MMNTDLRPTAIDLFSGGGGLSEGLKQAGFNIVAAVELDNDAASTFSANHPETKMFNCRVEDIDVTELKKCLNGKKLDLLTGCPPCQGFSNLTRRYKREDPRNSLIMEVMRIVEFLMPKAIMIENVPGLADKGGSYLSIFIKHVEELGYIVNSSVFQVADYGIPQLRKRFVLLAGLGKSISPPHATHAFKGKHGRLPWRTVRDVLMELSEPDIFFCGNGQLHNWHVVRNISPLNKERLKYIKPDGSRFDIPNELRPKCHQGKDTGFPNVYGRMSWDKPSPTITGGCTTLSKGRFGHPEKQRTISVREAAILQSFPHNYVFKTDSIDKACCIIGNAFPCDLAKILATNLQKVL